MAKLRRSRAYRRIERPYTRTSRMKRHNFIRVTPARKVTKFHMGSDKQYKYELDMIPKANIQVRQEAMESARQTSLRMLEANIPKGGFLYKIRKYPFHILRENPLAAGAGADRVSTGMKQSFGKPHGIAVQLHKGDLYATIKVNSKDHIAIARKALQRATKKMPCGFSIQIRTN